MAYAPLKRPEESARPKQKQDKKPARFDTCSREQKDDLTKALSLAVVYTNAAKSRSKALPRLSDEDFAKKEHSAVRKSLALFFGHDTLRDKAKKIRITQTVTAVDKEVRKMDKLYSRRIQCTGSDSDGLRAEYMPKKETVTEERYYKFTNMFFNDDSDDGKLSTREQAAIIIHEAVHHTTQNAGDIYTSAVSARALGHISGLPLEGNPDTITGFIIGTARNTEVGLNAVSSDYFLASKGGIASETVEKLQIVAELARWVLLRTIKNLHAFPHKSVKSEYTSLVIGLLTIADPAAERERQERSDLIDLTGTPDKYEETTSKDSSDSELSKWWKGNAIGLLDGSTILPPEKLVPSPVIELVKRWHAELRSHDHIRSNEPGFAWTLSQPLHSAIEAVSLPIPFADVGRSGSAVTRALILMLEDRIGVPAAVAVPMLRLFKSSPYKCDS